MQVQLIESGAMGPLRRRRGALEVEPTLPPREGDPDSAGFFERGGQTFEIRICDPRPTYYLRLTTEEADLFPEMVTRR